jgi:CHASE2 domain-containing sensor protein
MPDPTEHQRSTGVAPSAARGTFTAFGARHVKGVALARWVAAVCFVIAGALLFTFGQWWGVVFFLAAGLNASLAYLIPRWNAHWDTQNSAELSA